MGLPRLLPLVTLLALSSAGGCDWRAFDKIKANTPVLSIAKPDDNYGPNDDFGRYVLPLAGPAVGATGGRFIVSAGGTAAIGVMAIDAAGHPSGRSHSDAVFGTTTPIFPITSLAAVPGDKHILLGAPQGGTTGRGAVYIMALGTTIDSTLLDAPATEDHFGMAVGAGALSGGADPDFVVLSTSQLTVYLAGDPSQAVPAPTPAADCPLTLGAGLDNRDKNNRAMVVADLTGAGAPQILVGTPTKGGAGAVSVFTVAATGVATCAFAYRNPSARFGQALATGDFDGDGVQDLLVGAPPDGAFWIRGPLKADSPILDVELTPGAGQLGFAVGAGNVDGMPGDEAFVGDPDATVGGKAQAGEVHVVGGVMLGDELTVLRRHDPAEADAFGTQVVGLPFCTSACGGAGAVSHDVLLVGSRTRTFAYFVLGPGAKDPRTK